MTYTTPQLVKAELRASEDFASYTTPSLSDVQEWISEISDEISQLAGRVFTETEYTEVFDYGGDDILLLKNAPVLSIESVKYSPFPLGSPEYSLTQERTEDIDFTLYKEAGEIEILPNWKPMPGLKRIEVKYTAGFTQIPRTIQMLATKKVARRVIDTLLSKDINQKQSGKSVSVGSIRIVKPSDFGVTQYRTLNEQITKLEGDVVGGTSLYRLPMTRWR